MTVRPTGPDRSLEAFNCVANTPSDNDLLNSSVIYYCMHDILPLKGMRLQLRDLFKFW